MRTAAALLGLTGGMLALLMGIFAFGYTEAIYRLGDWQDFAVQPEAVDEIRAMSVMAPITALMGAGFVRGHPLMGAIALGGATAGLYWAFGIGFFSIFPVTLCGAAAILALLALRVPEQRM